MVSGAAYLGGPGQAFKSDFTYLQYRLATRSPSRDLPGADSLLL